MIVVVVDLFVKVLMFDVIVFSVLVDGVKFVLVFSGVS